MNYMVSLVNVELYHVPGTINVLADTMSRAISDNINCSLSREHPISKEWAKVLLPLTPNFGVDHDALFQFLTNNLKPEPQDLYDKQQRRLMEPKTVQQLFDLTKSMSDEQRYYNAIRLLEQRNDKYIKDNAPQASLTGERRSRIKTNQNEALSDDILHIQNSDVNETTESDLVIQAHAAKIKLDLVKQELCFKKLDEIMEKYYISIKGTALYTRILQNLRDAAKNSYS